MCMGMVCAECAQTAVDEAYASFASQKVKNLTKRAGLRNSEADVRSIDFSDGRHLGCMKVTKLATCGFVGRRTNVVL